MIPILVRMFGNAYSFSGNYVVNASDAPALGPCRARRIEAVLVGGEIERIDAHTIPRFHSRSNKASKEAYTNRTKHVRSSEVLSGVVGTVEFNVVTEARCFAIGLISAGTILARGGTPS